MGEREDRRRESRRRLFRRDGWQDSDGEWFVMCAYGCGDVIGWHEASINMHPTKARDGGRYTFDNTRLVCRLCAEADCNHKELPSYKRKRSNARRGRKPSAVAPQPMSVSANIDRLERLNARREARLGNAGDE